MFGGLILSAVFQPDQCIAAKRHQIGKQEAICRFNLILVIPGLLLILRADGMTGKWECHGGAAPVVSASAPLLRSGALCLRRETIVEKESWITLQRREV